MVKILRPALSVILILLWVGFLWKTAVPMDEYIWRKAKAVEPGDVVFWTNENNTLLLKGWSVPEEHFRWSQTRKPQICFKIDKTVWEEGSTLVITVECFPLPILVGHTAVFRLLPDGTEYPIVLSDTRATKYAVKKGLSKTSPEKMCLEIELPFTGRGNPGDPRKLGIALKTISFTKLP